MRTILTDTSKPNPHSSPTHVCLFRVERDRYRKAVEEIAEWVERYTMPGHPISIIARRALNPPKE